MLKTEKEKEDVFSKNIQKNKSKEDETKEDETKDDETNEEKSKEDKKKEDEKKKEIWTQVIHTTGDVIKSIFHFMEKKTDIENSNKNNSESKKLEEKNSELMKEIEELKKKQEKREQEEKEKKQHITNGIKIWNDKKKNIIESILTEINYINLIKKSFENNLDEFKKDIFKNISKILNDELKDREIIEEMHQKIFKKIKNDIPEIKTLNFITCGFSGAGKSTITNVILKDDLAKEGNDIHSVTQKFNQYSNPDKVPGLTIYDTIGVEPTNAKRNLDEIKKLIQDTFDENLKDPQKSLHGILYCIKNGNDANRIEAGEIKFIKDLDKLNGNCDILTIIFTQSLNNQTEKRIKELKEALNNDNIEIISVLAKDFELKIENQTIKFPAYGLDKLIASIKKNAKKIVKANLKQITKNKLKNEYIETTNTKYDDIKRKIKNQEFESTFAGECKVILENLIGNLDLKFDGLERVVSDFIEKLNFEVKKKFIDENQSKGLTKLYEEFGNLNTEYEGQIKDSSIKESFCIKLNNFYDTKIIEEVRKIILENASLLFIEKSRDFLSEIISDNVKDEEVDDVANSTLDHILEKINKIN